jgi:hypothetical protein
MNWQTHNGNYIWTCPCRYQHMPISSRVTQRSPVVTGCVMVTLLINFQHWAGVANHLRKLQNPLVNIARNIVKTRVLYVTANRLLSKLINIKNSILWIRNFLQAWQDTKTWRYFISLLAETPVFCLDGIGTCYGQDGSWIESRCVRIISHPSTSALGPNQPPRKWVLGVFPRVKAAEAWP